MRVTVTPERQAGCAARMKSPDHETEDREIPAVLRSEQGRTPAPDSVSLERRRSGERRRRVFWGLLYGSFNPRRRAPRRDGETLVHGVDWHPPRWLAVAVVIVLLSCADAFLTLRLIEQGAYELNPLMAPLLDGSVAAFAAVKITLTVTGVLLLTLLARVRAFGRMPVSLVLYAVLAAYGVLVVYEFNLLRDITPGA